MHACSGIFSVIFRAGAEEQTEQKMKEVCQSFAVGIEIKRGDELGLGVRGLGPREKLGIFIKIVH